MDLVGKWVVVTYRAGRQAFLAEAGGWSSDVQRARLFTGLEAALVASEGEHDVVPAAKVPRYITGGLDSNGIQA